MKTNPSKNKFTRRRLVGDSTFAGLGGMIGLGMAVFASIQMSANPLAAANVAHLAGATEQPHVVFVTGDEEYRSEETMPMLAEILNRDFGFTVTVCFALTDGVVDPNRSDNIEGLEVLGDADLLIMNTRFRRLPEEQLKFITDFAESGRPMAGFRTATHAFRYGDGHPMDHAWPQKVFGLPWISHDGGRNSTDVSLVEEHAASPVLRGVQPFHSRSWLYHANTLLESATPLLIGRSVRGAAPGGEHFNPPHVVAWVHHYAGEQGTSRVFFTTLGHPSDFKQAPMRTLVLNGIFWALGKEDEIPAEGLHAELPAGFDPNPSGFGDTYKPGLRPGNMLGD